MGSNLQNSVEKDLDLDSVGSDTTIDIKRLMPLEGTLVQKQLCIAKERILTTVGRRGYRFKQKLKLPNGKNRIHRDPKITERFMAS